MTDWEKLKEMVLKMRALGEDEGLDTEDYVDRVMELAEDAAQLVEKMDPPGEGR